MRKVRMLATWSETGNTSGDEAGFDDATAAHLVARGLAVYVDGKAAPAKRVPEAPPADKMVRTAETKAPELTATDEATEPPKTVTTRRRRRRPPAPANPIGENEGD